MGGARYNRRRVKGFYRILVNGVFLLSLLACIVAVAMGVRSYWVNEHVARLDVERGTGLNAWRKVISHRGVIAWATEGPRMRVFHDPGFTPGVWMYHASPAGERTLADGLLGKGNTLQQWGFIYHRWPQTELWNSGVAPFVADEVFGLPYWAVAAVFGAGPLWRFRRQFGYGRLRDRSRENLCRVCGYDLRATPERCPECGMIPAT